MVRQERGTVRTYVGAEGDRPRHLPRGHVDHRQRGAARPGGAVVGRHRPLPVARHGHLVGGIAGRQRRHRLPVGQRDDRGGALVLVGDDERLGRCPDGREDQKREGEG